MEKYLRPTRYQPLSERSPREARELMRQVRPQATIHRVRALLASNGL